jgi:hypothetical protein
MLPIVPASFGDIVTVAPPTASGRDALDIAAETTTFCLLAQNHLSSDIVTAAPPTASGRDALDIAAETMTFCLLAQNRLEPLQG